MSNKIEIKSEKDQSFKEHLPLMKQITADSSIIIHVSAPLIPFLPAPLPLFSS